VDAAAVDAAAVDAAAVDAAAVDAGPPPRLCSPTGLGGLLARWELVLGPRLPSQQHWISRVRRADGTSAVLKVAVADPVASASESAFLRAVDGQGAVRLLAEDAARGALLLEDARPGTPLTALPAGPDGDDAAATAVLVTVLRRLHREPPPGCPLPPLARQRDSFTRYLDRYPEGTPGPLPRELVERADAVFADLLASAPSAVLLHGDLHHDNVLRAEREQWLAIDPHGVVGDPGYDAGAALYNPWIERRDDRLLAAVTPRAEALADGLGQPVHRVLAWGFVKAVLSEVWTVEDGGEAGSRALDVALLLVQRLP
jgi:streptomycin 6-kinase